jgi:hypothetical protein
MVVCAQESDCKPYNGRLSETDGIRLIATERRVMTGDTNMKKTFKFRFIDAPPKVVVGLTNASENTLRSIEVLTIFLKDNKTPGGGPSQAHIRFDGVKSMQPGQETVLSHRTWINGKPADADHDQMEQLKLLAGQANPYALEISWEDPEGKMRFQRIAVGN